ncbi:MAG: hypothetical protein HY078_12680 [Elusimicrobia bacterium]|nr:hypothetical protein [Elusimicrobiota bacterium]
MIRAAACLLIASLLASPSRAADASLTGTWLRDGAPYATIRPDGTGTIDGAPVRWKADGKTLVIIEESGARHALPYTLKGDRLSVPVEGRPGVLVRAGGKSAAAGALKDKPAKTGGDDLSKLLLSSPWCYFHYNKVSGTSRQQRVVFRDDGTWGSGRRSESYSSGAYGTVSGQTDSADGGRWKTKSGRLFLSEGGGELQDVGLTVTKNSNGYPILKADGKEYSQCR